MSLEDPAIFDQMGFAPLDLVDVSIGHICLKLYPKIVSLTMPIHERAHAFQVNKATFTNLPTDFCLILNAFSMQLNASLTVEGILSDWHRFFKDQWMDFAHLTIISFHRSNGDRIDDTTLAANPQVLLSIVNGAVVGCRKQDVKFARMQCTLYFTTVAGLNMIYPYPASTTIRASYYIKLPQSSRTLTNDAGAPYNLVSFLGAADLRTLTPVKVHDNILLVIQQDAPVLL
jgi:hypothetical protein